MWNNPMSLIHMLIHDFVPSHSELMTLFVANAHSCHVDNSVLGISRVDWETNCNAFLCHWITITNQLRRDWGIKLWILIWLHFIEIFSLFLTRRSIGVFYHNPEQYCHVKVKFVTVLREQMWCWAVKIGQYFVGHFIRQSPRAEVIITTSNMSFKWPILQVMQSLSDHTIWLL